MIHVDLEPYEYTMAVMVGSRRQQGNRIAQRVPRNGMPEEQGWDHHIEGACGEVAVGKLLNIFWPGSQETFGDVPDLLPNIEVKTRSKHHYELLIRKHEKLDQVFVLVTGLSPHFMVHGWCVGSEVAQTRWLQSHGGRPEAYFIPQSELCRDWVELRRRINDHDEQRLKELVNAATG